MTTTPAAAAAPPVRSGPGSPADRPAPPTPGGPAPRPARTRPGRTKPARGVRPGIGPWLILPAAVLLALFLYRPLVSGVQLSLSGTDLFGDPTRFVGLENYVQLLGDPAFLRVVGTSLVIAALSTAMSVGGALGAVVLLRRWIPAGGLFRVVFSLPFAYSAASASAVFSGMLAPSSGVVNQLLAHLGVGAVPWLEQPGRAVFSIALTTAWYELGFAFLVLTAAMRSIPAEVVEAAELDGAGGFRMVRSVLVPLLSPSLFFLLVTQTISGLQTFTQVRILTGGGPAGSTVTLVQQLYTYAFGQGTPDYGRASVVAIVLVLVVALVTWLQFRFLNRRVTA